MGEPVRTPLIVVNLKAYEEALGPKALVLAKACAHVADQTGASIAIAPTAPDLGLIARDVRIPVLAQHVDAMEPGSRTGWLPPEAALAAGAVGTLLNHSERKVPYRDLELVVPRCRKLGLEVVCCADDLAEAAAVAKLSPDFVAIEPPELIGGDVSVTTAKPDVVSSAVARIHATNARVKVLCGAGVKTGRDVRLAIELGTVGVLLASGVVRAKDPKKALFDLAKALG